MEAGVRSKVGFDCHIVVASTLQLIAGVIDGASEEAIFVVREVLLDGRAEKVEEGGIIAEAGSTFAGENLCEDLFFEGVQGVGNAS